MSHTVIAVKPLPSYKLLLTFENGENRIFDVTPYLSLGVFAELKDVSLFNAVRISFDTVEWQNGADLCPDLLYTDSLPVNQTPSSQPSA